MWSVGHLCGILLQEKCLLYLTKQLSYLLLSWTCLSCLIKVGMFVVFFHYVLVDHTVSNLVLKVLWQRCDLASRLYFNYAGAEGDDCLHFLLSCFWMLIPESVTVVSNILAFSACNCSSFSSSFLVEVCIISTLQQAEEYWQLYICMGCCL